MTQSDTFARWTARGLAVLINGMLTGVGAVFLISGSLVVTALATVAAFLLAMAIIVVHR